MRGLAYPIVQTHMEDSMPPAKRIRTRALQLNIEGLLKLLGGTPDERERFWEILKGITTPAENRLIAEEIATLQVLVDQVAVSAKQIRQTAATIREE
jgi:RecJ-like exonuclease